MRLASSRRSRRSSAGCRGRSSSSGTGGDAAARGGRGRVMESSFSLPFMGRVVAQRPGGEGRGWARRVACGVAPTRLRLGLSHPPHEGEGDWAHGFGRRAFRRAVGGLGGAPGRRPECDVCYRFDADRRSARTGFHELGAGAGLIGYPRRPRRAGACLRQASRNGPRNPRDPGRNLSDGRVERPVTRLRRLLVLMPGLPPFGLLEAAKAASARWVASRASAPAFARVAALRILDRPARSARRAAGLPPSTGRRDGRRTVRQEPRSIRSRRPQGRRPHEPSMRRNEGRVAWRGSMAG